MAKLGMLKNTQSHTGTRDSQSATLTVKDIPIGDIRIQENVRTEYTGISELAESIRQYGLLQPITVYADKDSYIVKAGHRRFLAYQKLYQTEPERFHSIRCIISNADNTALIQLVENVQRVDLSQIDLFNALKELKAQGMTLKQIAEVMGKTEGYIKNLFVGINEINRDKDLHNMIGHAGVTISDIAETKGITNQQDRLNLLKSRKDGKINRAEMREKVKELAAIPKQKTAIVERTTKSSKIHISIKAFPTLNKVIIYQVKNGSKEQLDTIEKDVRRYFSKKKKKYKVEKAPPDREET
jgi:ParB family chromosome partitioning protein